MADDGAETRQVHSFVRVPLHLMLRLLPMWYLQPQKLCFRERMQLQQSRCTGTTAGQNLHYLQKTIS
uniref:Uncharacterized protein n=1 Tax=Arundo donax TaxID=35708 RepID=A0A0A9CZE7_ARUDO